MDDNIKFSAPTIPKRTIRSNNGADALFIDTLTYLFGVDKNCAYNILQMLDQTQQLGNLRKSIKLLSVQDHNQLNDILARSCNSDNLDTDVTPSDEAPIDTSDDISTYVNRRSTDDWNPEAADKNSQQTKDELPPVAKAQDYEFPERVSESNRSLLKFLMKEALNDDASLIDSADDDQFDDNTRQKLQSLMKLGNYVAANQLRNQMRQKMGNVSPNKPNVSPNNTNPLDANVQRTKQQYIQALKNRQRQTQSQNQMNRQ